jgi:hypothetical protein
VDVCNLALTPGNESNLVGRLLRFAPSKLVDTVLRARFGHNHNSTAKLEPVGSRTITIGLKNLRDARCTNSTKQESKTNNQHTDTNEERDMSPERQWRSGPEKPNRDAQAEPP